METRCVFFDIETEATEIFVIFRVLLADIELVPKFHVASACFPRSSPNVNTKVHPTAASTPGTPL
jgi:hypothetical protein